MTGEDVERLRRTGFSDEEILSINLITSYFNFVNRVAEGLGVEFSEEEVQGYNY
jgi:alkylhydroperoxidase family enzyme